jgi:hypothetical protein
MARPVPISKLAQELGINPRKWFGIPAPKPKPRGVSQKKVQDYIGEIAQVRRPTKYIETRSHDKRTIRSTQRYAREISKTAAPHEIAKTLGISTQRWTAIRKKIEQGKAYGPELREALKQATVEAIPEHEIREAPGGMFFDFFPSEATLLKNIKWAKKVTKKGYRDIKQAANWWEQIGGGADYFVIAASVSQYTGETLYNVYDIRTASELKGKGSLKSAVRAREIIREEYGNK